MASGLLEREAELAQLAAAATGAAEGHGSVTLIHGEAGIGKSSLVTTLRRRPPAGVRVLVGYCDDLSTPRPFGPIHDVAADVAAELAQVLRAGSADRGAVLAALRTGLDRAPRGMVLVFEDVHWADDATLDVLRYLVRRVAEIPLALVLTYRDDVAAGVDRLRPLIGQLADPGRLHRVTLRPLSAGSVRTMCTGRPVDAATLHAVTSGNPFFVTEVLTYGTGSPVPPTVVDAVLARLQRLTPDVRDAVQRLAVAGRTVERWLAQALATARPCDLESGSAGSATGLAALDPAEQQGLLVVSREGVAFRHELTRRAIVDSLPGARRLDMHGAVLAALVTHAGDDPSRLAYHAVEAGDVDATVRYGLPAACAAAVAGAHREAVAHYRSVLDHRDRFAPRVLAELLWAYAVECYTVGDVGAALTAQVDAVRLRRTLGEHSTLGADLRWLSRLYWCNGDRPEAERAAREAIETLAGAGDDQLLAMAYSNQAQLHAVADRYPQSIECGERAITLARKVGDPAVLSHALNNVGVARWMLGASAAARSMIEESARVALAADEPDHACRAYANLAGRLIEDWQFVEARRYLRAAMEVAERSEHLGFLGYLHLVSALAAFRAGEWDEVIRDAEATRQWQMPVTRSGFRIILGLIQVRRGEPGGDELLASIAGTGHHATELQRAGLIAAGRAEAAWLLGDRDGVRLHAEPVYEWARRAGHQRWERELGYWLHRSGHPVDSLTGAGVGDDADADPYLLQMSGYHERAAAVWQRAGCPYEQAAALAEAGRAEHLLSALDILDRLDAKPLARIVRAQLRGLGLSRVPRGPARTTRHNPAGLTPRQVEVARLLARDQTNAQIARVLVLSVRTVDNHVAAILDKLAVPTRRDASARIRELGILHGD